VQKLDDKRRKVHRKHVIRAYYDRNDRKMRSDENEDFLRIERRRNVQTRSLFISSDRAAMQLLRPRINPSLRFILLPT